MHLLIIGVTGHLGSRTAIRAAAAGHTVTGTSFTAPGGANGEPLDIRDRAAVHALIGRVRPDAVVNAAAGRTDWRLIADGSAHVALACATHGSRLVHLSTDAVFSGRDVDYDEDDTPDPIYLYGAAKAAAETAVRAITPDAAVVRTSVIIGHGLGQHEILNRDLIAGRVTGALFTDMIRKPVHVDDLAEAVLELAEGDHRGVLNVTGNDPISRYDLGILLARHDGLDESRIPAATIAGSGRALPTDVRLRTGRAAALLRTRLRGVREFLRTP